jgi:hypothetical protein
MPGTPAPAPQTVKLLENIRELLLQLEDEDTGPLKDQAREVRLLVDREIEELH